MSNEKQAVDTKPPGIVGFLESTKWKEEVKKVIPKEIMIDALLRVARSVASDNKFATADPRSFLQALLKCGRAGLYPDGREAHLMCFGREVIAIFDVKGICALAGRAGILVTPKLVHEADEFQVDEDDGTGRTKVVHRSDYRNPRGEVQAVYSRAVLPNGQVDYEIMTSQEVESVRQQYSKAKDSAPWKNSWGEMAKKTVIKRHSKRWDMSPDIRMAMNGDDDSLTQQNEIRTVEPIFKPLPASSDPPQSLQLEEHIEQPAVDKVRELCKTSGITEAQLLTLLSEKGIIPDGSEMQDLEENPEVLDYVVEKWPDITKRKETSGKKSKDGNV